MSKAEAALLPYNVAGSLVSLVGPTEDYMLVQDNCRRDWVNYFTDCLGCPDEYIWPKMREVISALQTHRRVAVKAGNAVSKTFTAAGIANCFSDIYGPDCSVITTAPTSKHLEDVLWGEIKNQRSKAKVKWDCDVTAIDIKRRGYAKWVFTGLTVRPDTITQQAAALQGYHNEWVLLIFDEASGVAPQIWAAAERLMTNERCYWLVIGNPPVNGLGEFVDCFKEGSGWHNITISVLDTPNYKEGREVIPGVSGMLFEQEQARKYGENSPRYMANVLGEIPDETEGTCYGALVGQAKREGRLGVVPYHNMKVHTARDIGSMHTAVIYWQIVDQELHIIDYYEDHDGVGCRAHIEAQNAKVYSYGEHYTGWDIAKDGPNAKQNGKYVVDIYAELGVNLQPIGKSPLLDGIAAVRNVFWRLYIDDKNCRGLIDALRHYKLHKVEKASVEGKPVYGIEEESSWATHGAAALRCLAMVVLKNDTFGIKNVMPDHTGTEIKNRHTTMLNVPGAIDNGDDMFYAEAV